MTTRLELLRKGVVQKGFMDSVFLRNKELDIAGDDVVNFPYKKSDLCYICISTTLRAIGQIPIKVYQQVGDDEFKLLPMNDPWQLIFDHPNYLMDRYSFVEAIVGFLMLDGDAFIVPFPPESPKPSSLWVVRKKFMTPIRDRGTNQLLGWSYNIKGINYNVFGDPNNLESTILPEGSIPLRVEEVSHIYFWNPYDSIMGMAPSEAGKLNIMVDYKASHYTANFLDDGAIPGGMLSTERGLTDKQFDRILAQFESKHQGYKRSYRVAVLENGLKYTQAGLSQKDMEFPKLRELTFRRVCQIYGMKEAIISETKTVNRATGQEERKEWWESTNLPIMRMICSALNFNLFPNSNLVCRFDTTKIEALRESLESKTTTGYKLWQMGATFNDINQRLDMGFPKYKWGKTWYMPVNLLPVEDYQPKLPISIENIPILPEGEGLLLPYLDKEEDSKNDAIWNNIIRQISPLEESFSKKISRVFFDMRKRTLDLLYHEKLFEEFQKDADDVEKELYTEEYRTLEKGTSSLYDNAFLLAVALLISEIGFEVSLPLTDPEALYFLTNKKIKVRGIIATIKNQIQKVLSLAYEKRETIDQMADRIRGVFDIAKSRTKIIATTEIFGTVNEGRFLGINRSGFREKTWYTALDERVRVQHRPMHGKIVRVGEVWVMPDGTYLRHPGDMNGPVHQIAGCRCIEIVVLESR